MQAWMASPSNRMIGETDGFEEILGEFVQRPHVVGGVVHDARIAAICIAAICDAPDVNALLTCHRDFRLFPELRTTNPFASAP